MASTAVRTMTSRDMVLLAAQTWGEVETSGPRCRALLVGACGDCCALCRPGQFYIHHASPLHRRDDTWLTPHGWVAKCGPAGGWGTGSWGLGGWCALLWAEVHMFIISNWRHLPPLCPHMQTMLTSCKGLCILLKLYLYSCSICSCTLMLNSGTPMLI